MLSPRLTIRFLTSSGLELHFLAKIIGDWTVASGAATVLLVPLFMSAKEQGYYCTIAGLTALYILLGRSLGHVTRQIFSRETVDLKARTKGCLVTPDSLLLCEVRGALFNQGHVLLQGRIKYNTLVLDKNSVDPAFIPRFLEFPHGEAPFTGSCEYHNSPGTDARTFKQGGDALCGRAYSCYHPSGYLFRKADLHEIRIVERLSVHRTIGNLPDEPMQTELDMRGPVAIFKEPRSLKSPPTIKSHSINAMKENVSFTQKGLLKTPARFSSSILGLPVATKPKQEWVCGRFSQRLRQCTLGYQNVMASEITYERKHTPTPRGGMLRMLGVDLRVNMQPSVQMFGHQSIDLPLSHDALLVATFKRSHRNVDRRISRCVA
jgi:hypothetical protein